MAKLCPKGKAAAKRKFDVYPSAYANMYASKVCKGKVKAKDGGRIKKDKGAFETESRRQKQKQRKRIKKIGESLRKLNPMIPRPGKRNGGIMKKEKYTDEQISRINKARSIQMRRKGPSVQVGGKPLGLLKSNTAKERGGNRIGSKNKRRFASGGLAKKGRGCEIR